MDPELSAEITDISNFLMMGVHYFNFARSVLNVTGKVYKRQRAERVRRFWVNPLNTKEKRLQQGAHHNLIREMREFDKPRFVQHLRMTPRTYDKLLELVTPKIVKQVGIRVVHDPGTRLEITLRYLATGVSCMTLANEFRVGKSIQNRKK